MRTEKLNKYPQFVLDKFKAVQCEDGTWVVELAPNKFLHWIDSVTDKPVTVSRKDLTMQRWNFKEEAEGIVEWLKKRWAFDENVTATTEAFTVSVNIEGD